MRSLGSGWLDMGQSCFYIRIIRPGNPEWCKGTIEDIQTGEQRTFKTLEEMLNFMNIHVKSSNEQGI
jgi:hypothetical protein